jgi:hypothetical protein
MGGRKDDQDGRKRGRERERKAFGCCCGEDAIDGIPNFLKLVIASWTRNFGAQLD